MQHVHCETCQAFYFKLWCYISVILIQITVFILNFLFMTLLATKQNFFCSVWPVRYSIFLSKSSFPNNLFSFPTVYLARIVMQGGMLEPILHLNNGTSGASNAILLRGVERLRADVTQALLRNNISLPVSRCPVTLVTISSPVLFQGSYYA